MNKDKIIEALDIESALFFYIDSKPIHVVASLDEATKTIYIITAYIPSSTHFCEDLKTW